MAGAIRLQRSGHDLSLRKIIEVVLLRIDTVRRICFEIQNNSREFQVSQCYIRNWVVNFMML